MFVCATKWTKSVSKLALERVLKHINSIQTRY